MGRPKGSKNKPKVTESAPSIAETNNIEYSNNTKQHTAAEMKEWYEKNAKDTQNAFKQISTTLYNQQSNIENKEK